MHLIITLRQETTRPADANSLAQQVRFDAFLEEFNTERPHEGRPRAVARLLPRIARPRAFSDRRLL